MKYVVIEKTSKLTNFLKDAIIKPMEEKILETIKKHNLIENGDKVVIGVSGGPDSITLLDVLLKIKKENIIDFDIVVCHINHMIREEAIDDESYVKDYCKKNNIECFVKRAEVEKLSKEQKCGTEEAGRKVRYEFFYEVLENTKSNKIATAHNANDNAETVLMNIIRGSGTSGLKGIEAKRANLIRPLIECKREEIEEYCEENNLNPRIDKTNYENTYTRNKIRNMLLPYIKENFNPNIISSINRLSDLSKQENEYLEKQTEKKYKELMVPVNTEDLNSLSNKEKIDVGADASVRPQRTTKDAYSKLVIALDLKKFNLLEKVIKSRLVLYTINELLETKNGIEKKHIEDIIKLCSNNIGNKYLIPNKKVKILIKNKKIFFIVNQ